ncbi:MAG: pyridoxamine 5'-phosphate oxidase family protein [bacterium]
MLNEIKLYLAAQDHPTAFLATIDRLGNPRVRPVTLMVTPQGFYIATSRKTRKAEEISHHNVVEWVTLFPTENGTGYLRLAGKVDEVIGEEKRNTVVETDYPVSLYWDGVADPDFVVFKIIPERVEYIRPGENDAHDLTESLGQL